MPRLREIPRAEVTDEQILFFYDRLFGAGIDPLDPEAPASDSGGHRTIHGTPGDWWTVFAQAPQVFSHAVRGFALYRKASLDPLLRELGQARAGYAPRQPVRLLPALQTDAFAGDVRGEDRRVAVLAGQ